MTVKGILLIQKETLYRLCEKERGDIMRKIILASASPRRKELLENAGVVFVVQPGSGEEIITKSAPDEIVEELSLMKAQFAAGEEAEGTLIIGSDTVVAYQGEILGKPSDEENAVRTLRKLQGNVHQVYTGVTVLERRKNEWIPYTFSECTNVEFYPVTEEEIQEYVSTGEPMDKAGSYAIQGKFNVYVKGIQGDYSNVVGLPVARLLYEMKQRGIDLRKC